MSYTTPKYGITVPSPATQVKELGAELQEMGVSIESVLESFDYNGADPNLVLSRMSALEIEAASLSDRIDVLESVPAEASGVVTLSLSSAAPSGTVDITFPPGRFSTAPLIFVTKQSGALAKYIPYVASKSASGATLGIYSGDGTSSTGFVGLAWRAIPA